MSDGEGDTWTLVNDASTHNLSVFLAASGGNTTYRRRAVSVMGCVSEWDNIVVTVHPVITNVINPVYSEVCGNVAELTTQELSGGDGKYTCDWEFSTNNQNWNFMPSQQDCQPDLIHQEYGEYFYRRLVVSGMCSSISNVVKIRFDRQPEPSEFNIRTNNIAGDMTGEKALRFQFGATLDVHQPSDAGMGSWSTTSEGLRFDPSNRPQTNVSNLPLDTVTVKWTARNGVCQAISQSAKIEVANVLIPSGFSPNDDQINDCFVVVGGENAISSELRIFDRYNKLVFESKSNSKNPAANICWWDGRSSSGNELPTGSYFYQMTLKGDNEKIYMYRGYVALKRQ